MTLYEIYPEISDNIIFADSSQDSVNKYIANDSFWVSSFAPHERICSPRDNNTRVGIIISGTASVSSDSGNAKFVLKTLVMGDMFGIANLYSADTPFPSVICAKTDVKCLFISGDAFRAFLENDAQALKQYLKLLNNKIIYLNHKITIFTASNTEKKLAVFLYENQIDNEVKLSCSMSALSELLGLGRASLYRAIDKLTDLGLIARQDKKILIPDNEKLKRFFTESNFNI